MTAWEITTQSAARALFWVECSPDIRAAGLDVRLRYGDGSQNRQPADVRAAWVEWINQAARAGRMSERLAERVTL